jgi:ribonuclease VapC
VKRYVLDASAVMAFFENRPGADGVRELLVKAAETKHFLLMSVVNWGEVYYSVWAKQGEEVANESLRTLAQFPIEVVDVDMEMTKLAASFKAKHKLPYADAFAAALAENRNAYLMTTDKDFSAIEEKIRILWGESS